MLSFQEIQEVAFRDAKDIIESLHGVNSAEELKDRKEEVHELQDLLTFLAVSEKYGQHQNERFPENTDLHLVDLDEEEDEQTETENKYIAEEEVIFNNTFNQIDDSEIHHPEIGIDVLEEEAVFNNELNEIEAANLPPVTELQQTEISEDEEYAESETVGDRSAENPEAGMKHEEPNESVGEEPSAATVDVRENRRKIVEIEREEKMQQLNEAAALIQEQHEEKKFRLSNIKGLKKIQSLFEEDPLEERLKEDGAAEPVSGSLLKTNVRTDFMEAEKPKNEFKLDLNDKIAFSKMLFGGSQTKMNETITALNSFKTLEEAREYLSEAYYKYDWDKSDEYAQRLWSLVENKFI